MAGKRYTEEEIQALEAEADGDDDEKVIAELGRLVSLIESSLYATMRAASSASSHEKSRWRSRSRDGWQEVLESVIAFAKRED